MNNYFRTIDSGGWNPCIYGNTAKYPRRDDINVLPNCVGYAVGRFNEMAQTGDCRYLGNSNANWFMNWAYQQGLETGDYPEVGACMVWDDGNCGHVAIIEEVHNENEIVVSESGWNGNYLWSAVHYKNNNWCSGDDEYWMGTKYRFIGFIYNPVLRQKNKIPLPVEENKEVDQLRVNCADTMRVRTGHSTNSECIGMALAGYYNVINSYIDDNYTWLEVEENKWIALYHPYCEIMARIQIKEEDNTNTLDDNETSENEPKNEEIDIHNQDKESVIFWIIKLIIKVIRRIKNGRSNKKHNK